MHIRSRLRRRRRLNRRVQVEKLLENFTRYDVRDVFWEDFGHEFKHSGVKRNERRHQQSVLLLVATILRHRVVVVVVVILHVG